MGHSERSECPVQALVAAAKAGDGLALERLLGAHERELFVLCFAALSTWEDAEDAVQETFYRAIMGLRGYRGDSGFRTWLSRIAVNVCLRWRARRRQAVPYDPALREHAMSARPVEDTVMRRLEIAGALAQLPPRQRLAVVMHGLQGHSPAEIALIMGCSRRRVYHDLSQAHTALARWRRRAG